MRELLVGRCRGVVSCFRTARVGLISVRNVPRDPQTARCSQFHLESTTRLEISRTVSWRNLFPRAYPKHQPAALCSCRKRPELASLGLEEFDEDLEDTVVGALEQMLKSATAPYQHIPPGSSSQPCEDQFAIHRYIGYKRHCPVDFCSIEAYRCSVGREQFEIETNEGALW